MATGKQKKKKQIRNISGLRNQAKASPAPSLLSQHSEEDGDELEHSEMDDEGLELLFHFDSLKTNFQNEEEHEEYDENNEDEECIQDWEGFNSQEMSNALGEMVKEDDPDDLDWMPPKMRNELDRMEKLKKSKYSQYESAIKKLLKTKCSEADILQERTGCYEQI